jgi:hypothetical protein
LISYTLFKLPVGNPYKLLVKGVQGIINYIFVKISNLIERHFKVAPSHHSMARLQVVGGGGGLQIWRVL